MNKKQEKLDKLLELSQLINKNVFFENELYKIFKVNTIYIYCYNYELDNELSIDNNIIFLSANDKPTIYEHYTNNILFGITKIKLSIFYDFKIIDIDKLSDTYLINKTVFFEGDLYKILKVNTVYIYGYNYEVDSELSIDNNIIFLLANNKTTTYKHYTNNILFGITKIKLSIFYDFKIIDIDKLSDTYFINNLIHTDYYNSKFYTDKNYLTINNDIFKLIYSTYHGPMFNKNNSYYFDFRKQILIEHFNNTKLNEEQIKITCNDLQNRYENYRNNFYDEYINLYNEYKTYI